MMVFVPVPHSEAATKITFVNRTDRNVYVAIYTGAAEPITHGWYNIAPGSTWLFESRENIWNVGYYAEGHTRGEKTLYWEGGELLRGWIHPTEPFNIGRNGENRPAGSRQVGFRYIQLTREFDLDERITNFVGSVTFIENPQSDKPRAVE